MTHRLIGVVFTLIFVASATIAKAEPITLNYEVTVTERQDLANFVIDPFNLIFSLSVTFDDAVTFSQYNESVLHGEVQSEVLFGPPTFSVVPTELSHGGPTLGDPLHYSDGQTIEGRQLHPSGDRVSYGINARAIDSGVLPTRETSLSLFVIAPTDFATFADVGVPTISSFVAGMMLPQSFVYGSSAYDTDSLAYVPGSIFYTGTARFVSQDPTGVPEPGSLSLVLLGMGAAFAAKRRLKN